MKVDNFSDVLFKYMQRLNIPVSLYGIMSEMERHPFKTSLLAMSDILNNWNIPNAAFKIDFKDIADVPLPFIACLKDHNGLRYTLVEDIQEDYFLMTDIEAIRKRIDRNVFQKWFTGSVFVAQKDPESAEPDYKINHRKGRIEKLRIPFSISVLFLFVAVYFYMYFPKIP